MRTTRTTAQLQVVMGLVVLLALILIALAFAVFTVGFGSVWSLVLGIASTATALVLVAAIVRVGR